MGEKKVYATIDGLLFGMVLYDTLRNSLNILGLKKSFIFYSEGPGELSVSYVIKKEDQDGEEYVISDDSPIEAEVPSLSKIYSQQKEGFISRKLEAILKTSPVGIIVPTKGWAKILEREVIKRGYEFEFVD